MQGIFQKENTDKALKYGIYRHLPTYEKIIRNLVSFYRKESLDITKIKDPEHSKESEVDFSGNLGRGVLLLSILFVIVYAILLVKFRRYIGAFEASLTPMIIGLISSILILPLHELLHAICISSKNNVQIYRVKSGLMTWFTAPITKRRYLGMLLVPVLLLGFIPSICTFVIPETMPGFITFVLIFSLGNIGMSCGDLTNFIITAIKVKKGNKVLPCKNGIFKVQ